MTHFMPLGYYGLTVFESQTGTGKVHMEIQISVRGLVEFILRSGNIDNRKASSPENAMQEGGRIHRMIQRRMGADYHAEVMLRYVYATENYEIHIDGRADGILIQPIGELAQTPELTDVSVAPAYRDLVTVTIDEIKGTYRDLAKIREAQGYIWRRQSAMPIFMEARMI